MERSLDLKRGEWLADAVVHAIGVAGALVAAVLVLKAAASISGALPAASVYAATLVAMPLVSGAYNLLTIDRLRPWLRRLDQATIFLLIAASYTPFAVIGVGGIAGAGFAAFVWTLALTGACFKLFMPHRLKQGLSVGLYLALGWCGIVALPLMLAVLEPQTLVLLGAGGVLYSAGVIFHLWDGLRYQNAVWHAFVVTAAACHALAVLSILPV